MRTFFPAIFAAFLAAIFAVTALVAGPAHAQTRIKDIASVQGVRENQLIGYGLVTGLQGTGDTLRNSQFTEQSLQAMLDRMGVNVREVNLRTRNVAAVMITADLPASAIPASDAPAWKITGCPCGER